MFAALRSQPLLCVWLQRTFREIMFLQELNNHENIIRCGAGGCHRVSCALALRMFLNPAIDTQPAVLVWRAL